MLLLLAVLDDTGLLHYRLQMLPYINTAIGFSFREAPSPKTLYKTCSCQCRQEQQLLTLLQVLLYVAALTAGFARWCCALGQKGALQAV